jgi:hypothetical protein
VTSTDNNPYGGSSIPGQRQSPDQPSPDFTTPDRSVQWPTVGFGIVASLVWILVTLIWGVPAFLSTVFGTIALVVLAWVIGLPVYLIAAKALADKEITKNELKAMFNWPTEFALLAKSGGYLRDNDGNRQFAQQIDREDDTSETIASGFKAYALVFGLSFLALLLVGTVIALFVDILLTLAFLAVLLYVGGMLAYFWTCGLIREPLSGKLMGTLAVYPWDMFKKVLGTA